MSKLKYFEEGPCAIGFGARGIILEVGENEIFHNNCGIFSLEKRKEGKIRFREEGEGDIFIDKTQEEAIAIFQEAIDWIKEKQNE